MDRSQLESIINEEDSSSDEEGFTAAQNARFKENAKAQV